MEKQDTLRRKIEILRDDLRNVLANMPEHSEELLLLLQQLPEKKRKLRGAVAKLPAEVNKRLKSIEELLSKVDEHHSVSTRLFKLRMNRKASQDRDLIDDHRRLTSTGADQFCYRAINMFCGTPRRLADVYLTISKYQDRINHLKEESKNEANGEADKQYMFDMWRPAIRNLVVLCGTSLLEEEVLSPEARQLVQRTLGEKHDVRWDWNELPISPKPVLGREHTILDDHIFTEIPDGLDRDGKRELDAVRCTIQVCRARDWRFTQSRNKKNKGDAQDKLSQSPSLKSAESWKGRELSSETSATLMLLHDMLVLGPDGNRFSGSLLRFKNESDWKRARTIWRSGLESDFMVRLNWPGPECLSFWGLDLFHRAWNETIQQVRESQRNCVWPEPKEAERHHVLTLAYTWISAGCSITDMKPPCGHEHLETTGADWDRLFGRLEDVITFLNREEPRWDHAFDWLSHVALLLMPEYGLPKLPVGDANRSTTELFERCRRRDEMARHIRALRAKRLAKIRKKMPNVAEHLRTEPATMLDSKGDSNVIDHCHWRPRFSLMEKLTNRKMIKNGEGQKNKIVFSDYDADDDSQL